MGIEKGRTRLSSRQPHADLPNGWLIETVTNRWGQSASIVWDEDNNWVAEAKTPEQATQLANEAK